MENSFSKRENIFSLKENTFSKKGNYFLGGDYLLTCAKGFYFCSGSEKRAVLFFCVRAIVLQKGNIGNRLRNLGLAICVHYMYLCAQKVKVKG